VRVVRRPDDPNPEPPGGRAAERLRDFLQGRFPDDEPPLPEGAGGPREPPPPPPPADDDATRGRTAERAESYADDLPVDDDDVVDDDPLRGPDDRDDGIDD
jgi:hypothetical protein